jgi:hypothetical protein
VRPPLKAKELEPGTGRATRYGGAIAVVAKNWPRESLQRLTLDAAEKG